MTSGTETVRVLVEHNRDDGRVEPGEEIVVSNKEARELETMGWGINVEKADLGDLAAASLIEANAEEQALAQEEAEAQEQAQEEQKERVFGSSEAGSASSSHFTGSVDPQGRVQSVEDSKYEASASGAEDEPKAKSREASASKSSSKAKSKE